MDTLMVVLRLIHIFAGIVWFGFGMFMLFLLVPTVRQLGPEGQVFMRGFLKRSAFNTALPVASVLATVAGAWMYYKVSDGFNADWMKASSGVVLSIGVVAGIMAFGHGAGVTGRLAREIVTLGDTIEAQGSPPSPEQVAGLQTLQQKMILHGQISIGLMAIAVAGMAAARYM